MKGKPIVADTSQILREIVVGSFRSLLGRNPADQAINANIETLRSLPLSAATQQIIDRLLMSEEFQLRKRIISMPAESSVSAPIVASRPVAVRVGKADVEELFAAFRGHGIPDPFGPFVPSTAGGVDPSPDTVAELASLLWSIRTAGSRFRMLSLGAAPGEWAVKAQRAYAKLHPAGDYLSISVEADPEHAKMIREFFTKNGADPDHNDVIEAVVADRNGWAYFPIIKPGADWGGRMVALSDTPDDLSLKVRITDEWRNIRVAANGGKPLQFRTIKAVSLESLLDRAGVVDFIHSDIQGSEQDVFRNTMRPITDSVKICCIGTHGREIEEALTEAFADAKWVLDCGYPCGLQDNKLKRDGVFVWSNPRFFPDAFHSISHSQGA
jgi:FkbM family methyltransferase